MLQPLKKHIVLGLIAVLALSIPVTVGMLQRQQETRSRASASTTLSFSPSTTSSSPIQKNVGDIISLDLMVTPGNNAVTFVKFELKYDPTKLQPVSPDPFTLNTDAFLSKDGPILSQGSLLASASVGSDPTKAIKQPTKVGTIKFKALANTGSTPAQIEFSDLTQALSSGSNDQAAENVISTTSPANVAIGGYTAAVCTGFPAKFVAELKGSSEVPSTNSTATGRFTMEVLSQTNMISTLETTGLQENQVTMIHIHSPADPNQSAASRITLFDSPGNFKTPYTSGTNIGIPTDVLNDIRNGKAYVNVHTTQHPNGEIRGQLTCAPDATAVPTRGAGTPLQFELLLHGIGNAGDNPNPQGNDLSNKNPLHPQRNLLVEIYDTNNQLVSSISGDLSLNYDDGSGSFLGELDATGIKAGSYNLKVKTDRYLRKRIPGIVQIKPNQENQVPSVDMVAGDTNSDNVLNVIDYNAFLDCGYGEIEPLPILDPNSVFNSKECQAHTPPDHVDIDDNGTINSFDYNLFLRELSVQNGD